MADECVTTCEGNELPVIDGSELSHDGDRMPIAKPNAPEYTLEVRNLEQDDNG